MTEQLQDNTNRQTFGSQIVEMVLILPSKAAFSIQNGAGLSVWPVHDTLGYTVIMLRKELGKKASLN